MPLLVFLKRMALRERGLAGGLVLLLRIPRGPGRPVAATSRPAGPHPKGLHLEQVRAEMAT